MGTDATSVINGLTGPAWQAVLLALVLYGGYKLADQLIDGLLKGLGEIRDAVNLMHKSIEDMRNDMRPK